MLIEYRGGKGRRVGFKKLRKLYSEPKIIDLLAETDGT